MRNMLLIARREFNEQIRGRAFRLSTIGVPLIFALVIVIGYASTRGLGSRRHIVVAAQDAGLAAEVRSQLLSDKRRKATIEILAPASPAARTELTERVRRRDIDGFLWIDGNGAVPTATYTARAAGDFTTSARLQDGLDNGFVEEHLTAAGMSRADSDAVVNGIKIESFQVKKNGSVVRTNAQASFWKGYVMAILLSMTTMLYGMNVARSIIQEKTSRIFEVMLATARPSEMMAGKLIGVGAVGMTQIAIWRVAGAVIIGSPFAAEILSGEYAVHFSWTEAVLFPVYFLLGYLLYSSLFAGLAATCETEQELQMYMPLAAAPTWISFALIVMVMNDSNSFWSIAASLFPPTAPVIMFLRMASEIPPLWQFAASIGLMVVSIWVTLRISSKLYRVGILMYGKRATLPELVKWLRYS